MAQPLTFDSVYRAVSEAALHHGIEYDEQMFYGRRRQYPIVIARSTVGYILRSNLLWPFCVVGKMIGRDHSTVVYYARVYPDRVMTDPTTSAVYERSCNNLGIKPSLDLCKFKPVKKIRFRPSRKKQQEKESDDYIVPLNYTAAERKAIRNRNRDRKTYA
jgi:hypothetical protein